MSLAKVLAPERIALASAYTEEEALEEVMAAANALDEPPTQAEVQVAKEMGVAVQWKGVRRLSSAVQQLEIYRGVTCA